MKYRLAVFSFFVLACCAACGSRSEIGTVDRAQPPVGPPVEAASVVPSETMRPNSAIGGDGFVTGELTEVDVERQTFGLLADAGFAYTFHYSESTPGTSGEGAEGLATQEGSRISVIYDAASDPPEVLMIDVIDIAPFLAGN